jgi:UPF0102 protein BDI_2565
MNKTKKIGTEGEILACQYLEQLGMKILARNWHFRHYELDIIARSSTGIHVVEVKTRYHEDFLALPEIVSNSQIERLIAATQAYIETFQCIEPVQIDLLVIITKSNRTEFEYYPDAFHDSF